MSVDFEIEFEGLERLTRDLRKVGKDARGILHQAMHRSLTLISSAAKPKTPVDTGRLRASIGDQSREGIHEVKGLGADTVGWVGSRVVYAPYQELGFTTKRGRWIEGKHFLENAARENVGRIVRIFEQAIDRLLRGHRL